MSTSSPPAKILLSISGVSKTYVIRNFLTMMGFRQARRLDALRDVSFDLREGEITALLGPNGAGKTTLATIVTDLTRANSGNVRVAGIPVPRRSREAQRQIGYLTTNDRSFFWRLSGRRNLEFFAALYGFREAEARRRTVEMLEQFNLTAQADRPFHSYSTGMKKRLGLARAFLHDPKVLGTDEATNGLDAKATEDLIDLVGHQIRRKGKTVLWATHRAEEIERLCDRVIVLISGQVRFDGSSAEFLDTCRRHMRFSVEAVVPVERRAALLEVARSLELTVVEEKVEGRAELSGTGDEHQLSTVLLAMLNQGILVDRVERVPEPLHHLFARLEDEPKSAVKKVAAG